MEPLHYILATAGHIDHGKSALVRALSGSDPDRLPEEKKRGITIELGFAHLDLCSTDGRPISVGIIDVPGHEDFVKNMVAGVGSIDCGLLVVAADDGWMPQTEEHFQILDYLGVTHGIVALTKADLPDADVELATEDVRERLAGSPLEQAPIIPVSAHTGEGLETLKIALATSLAQIPPPMNDGKPRLLADRVFTLKGIGTVVTGTLSGGSLSHGQTITLQPGNRKARVRSLQSHNQEVKIAPPGTRTAVCLSDASRQDVLRGETLTLPHLGEPSETADIHIQRSPNSPQRILRNHTRIRVHHGSANTPARLVLMDQKEIKPGESEFAQLRFESPVHLLAGDRVVIRDWPETSTLAGGIIIDPTAPRRGFRSPPQRTLLQQCAQAVNPDDSAKWAKAHLQRLGAVLRRNLLKQSRFGESQIDAALGVIDTVQIKDWVADPECWKNALNAAATLINTEHTQHPERPGLPLATLRKALREYLPTDSIDILLDDLCTNGFSRNGTLLSRDSHTLTLPPAMQAAAENVRAALRAKPMEPPARKDLGHPDALRFLLDNGEAVELSPDLAMDTHAFDEAVKSVRTELASGGAKASKLREVIGTSRRVLIPLLEKMDKDGITLRQGDLRVLRQQG
ncbi:MAG: selenocysteine-specific translation elongation factor [Verrucomicrobiales bacterium]|nr:selenocysteine-specific translation elongation factor [Verrucomicrobiales bacterium]|tara:strand:+ start:13510 stop:15393 length:1884 start_codon:yes stop_codon:yes gene_type:complete